VAYETLARRGELVALEVRDIYRMREQVQIMGAQAAYGGGSEAGSACCSNLR